MSEPSTPPASSVWAAGGVWGGLAPRAPDPAERGGVLALTDTLMVQSRSSPARLWPIADASTKPFGVAGFASGIARQKGASLSL